MADVIVTGDGGSRSGVGAGVILGIIIAILAVLFVVWYFGFGGNGSHATNINVAPPQINVQVPKPAAS